VEFQPWALTMREQTMLAQLPPVTLLMVKMLHRLRAF
jgi:hypothetical protein